MTDRPIATPEDVLDVIWFVGSALFALVLTGSFGWFVYSNWPVISYALGL